MVFSLSAVVRGARRTLAARAHRFDLVRSLTIYDFLEVPRARKSDPPMKCLYFPRAPRQCLEVPLYFPQRAFGALSAAHSSHDPNNLNHSSKAHKHQECIFPTLLEFPNFHNREASAQQHHDVCILGNDCC